VKETTSDNAQSSPEPSPAVVKNKPSEAAPSNQQREKPAPAVEPKQEQKDAGAAGEPLATKKPVNEPAVPKKPVTEPVVPKKTAPKSDVAPIVAFSAAQPPVEVAEVAPVKKSAPQVQSTKNAPKPKEAPTVVSAASTPGDSPIPPVEQASPVAVANKHKSKNKKKPAGGDSAAHDLAVALRQAPLSDETIQQLIEILLNKQQNPSRPDSDWIQVNLPRAQDST
jgi:hypothetical protein